MHENTPMTAIPLGPDSVSLPRAMFQGKKEAGILVTGGEASSWYWDGIKSVNGTRCIYTRTKGLKPFSMLFDTHIPLSSRIELFLMVLSCLDTAADQSDNPWFQKGFPLNAVWILPGSGILILPRIIADVMLNAVTEKERDSRLSCWLNPKAPVRRGWIQQMAAVCYAVISGTSPFEDPSVRKVGYLPYPLWMLSPSASEQFSQQLNNWLTLSSPLPTASELGSCISAHKTELIQPATTDRIRKAEQAKAAYGKLLHGRARRREFLRKHGLILAGAAVLIIAAVSVFLYFRAEAAKPPPTAGMEPSEVAAYYYQLQDELRLDKIQKVLTSSAEDIRQDQLIYLHVANAVRRAYSDGESIPAERWIAEGKPSIPASSAVYGITELDIKPLNDLSFEASFILWLPDIPVDQFGESLEHGKTAGIRYTEHLILTERNSHYLIDHVEIIDEEQVY